MQQSILTSRYKTYLADRLRNSLTVDTNGSYSSNSNTYIGLGRVRPWANNDANTEYLYETTNTHNRIYNNLFALKKITAQDISLVVPRVDWANNTPYVEYREDLQLFTYDGLTVVANGVSTVAGNTTVYGGNDAIFTTSFSPGDFITLIGDNVTTPTVKKEVVSIANDTILTVNSAFANTYTQYPLYKTVNTYPDYANKFYVRNTKDQVFKCLSNNSGSMSTTMPQINIDGNLPSNPYIITADGYKWKYMYTIPGILKKKFFTAEWMPIVENPVVTSQALFGTLDIIEIKNGGLGYNSNTVSNSVPIITIDGDGTGANVSAIVGANGIITGVNVLNRGINYTSANVIVTDVNGSYGTGANLTAIIEPPTAYPVYINGVMSPIVFNGGHGANVKYELGATTLMISTDISPTESGVPFENSQGAQPFDYREISIIRNPLQYIGTGSSATIQYASAPDLSAVYKLVVSAPPAAQFFSLDELVYQAANVAAPSIDNSTFKGTTVYWSSVDNAIWLNNVSGHLQNNAVLFGTVMTSPVKAISIQTPDVKPFTGDILYINNRAPVQRALGQTEQIRIVLQF